MDNNMLAELDEVVRLIAKEEKEEAGKPLSILRDNEELDNACYWFMKNHHATLADMAKRLEAAERDAAYGRALIEAMNAEYQAAKTSRKGGKQAEWLTTYCLLRRVKVAADHLTDMGNPITEQDQELAAIDATQEGEG